MDNPPSYSDAVSKPNPSAPLMPGQSPSHNTPQSAGWNHHTAQQYPQNQGPVVHQMVQPHMTQPAPQTVVIINQQIMFGPNPTTMMCPNCHQLTNSRVFYESNWMTHLTAGILCLMGWCPCALIPYCTDCLKDAVHRCSKCNAYLGTYRRSNRRY